MRSSSIDAAQFGGTAVGNGAGIGASLLDPCRVYPFRLVNVGGATAARVVGQADDTHVWLARGYERSLLVTLAENDVHQFATQGGDRLCANQPIWASGEAGSKDIAFQPDWSASNEVGGTMSRSGGIDIDLLSIGATSAEVFYNGVSQATLTLTPSEVSTFTQTGNPYTGNWRVVANGPVLGFKHQDLNGNSDSSPLAEPSGDIVGFASTAAYISSAGNVGFRTFPAFGTTYAGGTTGSGYNIVNQVDLSTPGGANALQFYDQRSAVRSQALSPLYGNGRADGDGNNDTAHFPVSWMRTHHRIPQPSEFVGILNLTGAPVQIFDANNNPTGSITPTRANADPSAPFSARDGSANGASNFNAGRYYVCADPIYLVYQPKGSGSFGSDDDETVSYGWDL